MNQVKLIGNVGSTPTIKVFENSKLASFSLATKNTFQTRNQEEKTTTQWHKIVAWGENAKKAEELIEKGKLVEIEGSLQTRNYVNQYNQKVYITEVVAYKITEKASEKKERKFFL
ncbi:MAG: single-stranded DNA-binding protein [Cytophagaceae bacterium]|nr:single-stranded DNA-binding protein [Cytophagaceae bacterium]MBK9932706.1 single-stranded DNA-binding protein [Cytophagaceae bacterium]MBL0303603.1 single-stranded DNA-binding protein [Cytophagaceae bacterium]MBL0326432.1 single-stranded DNA-binding protein [Cytophagaceae bacterium]